MITRLLGNGVIIVAELVPSFVQRFTKPRVLDVDGSKQLEFLFWFILLVAIAVPRVPERTVLNFPGKLSVCHVACNATTKKN